MVKYTKLLRGGYRAELGHFSEFGKTKKEALEALLALFEAIPSDTEPTIWEGQDGAQWILWFEGRSWAYRRVPMLGKGEKVSYSCTVLQTREKHAALDTMRSDMAQYYKDVRP